MKKAKTNRGFSLYKFKDRYGEECSLQKSSIVHPECVWLGCDGDQKTHPVTGDLLSTRMHIDRKLAAKLAKKLQKFADTGEI